MQVYEKSSGRVKEIPDNLDIPEDCILEPSPGGLLAPVYQDGVWVSMVASHTVQPLTPEQQEAEQARVKAIQDAATIKYMMGAAQHWMDTFARTLTYDSMLTACTYATSDVLKFKAEGQYAVWLRDTVWATLAQILADVQAGNRPAPATFEDIIPELPVPKWPEVTE